MCLPSVFFGIGEKTERYAIDLMAAVKEALPCDPKDELRLMMMLKSSLEPIYNRFASQCSCFVEGSSPFFPTKCMRFLLR